jgi:hypothetical protein
MAGSDRTLAIRWVKVGAASSCVIEGSAAGTCGYYDD